MEDLFVRSDYDGKDLRQVIEVYYINNSGEEVVHERATQLCLDLACCADMGDDTYETLRIMVEGKLRAVEIPYRSLTMDDD